MATKLGRMVACLDRFLTIMSSSILVTWYCKIMWQNKKIISPIPQCIWPPNLTLWWLTLISSYTQITWQTEATIYPLPQCLRLPYFGRVAIYKKERSLIVLQLRNFVRSRDNNHQTWQRGNLLWGVSSYKFT